MTMIQNSQSFRERLKHETASLHDLLERTYPFSELASTHSVETSIAALQGFALIFKKFLEDNAKNDDFYQASLAYLGELPPPSSKFTYLDQYNHLAMRYLFLGSRMGNELITRKNPEIVKTPGGKYFDLEFPRHLWAELLQDLQKIEDSDTENLVIDSVKTYLDAMVKYGNSLERQ